jgi:hypothetical protein
MWLAPSLQRTQLLQPRAGQGILSEAVLIVLSIDGPNPEAFFDFYAGFVSLLDTVVCVV